MAKIKLSFDLGEELDYEYLYAKIAQATGYSADKVEEITEEFYAENKYVDMTLEVIYDTETRISERKLTLKEDE